MDQSASVMPDPEAIAEYIHASKYARWREDLGRRELYTETVDRVRDMHLRRFVHLPTWFLDEIRDAFELVREKRVLPSMRSFQFAGPAIETNHLRGFNCAATLIDRPRAFAETFYLLLCGCGVGYSVQKQHVAQLPPISADFAQYVVQHVVADTIEGWADALDVLIGGAIAGYDVEFDFSLIRAKGSPLKTSGGRAPGPEPLRTALEQVRGVLLGARGRQLSTLEAHTINCHGADAVLSGGIRRSAMLALFSLDDHEMMGCKADASWFQVAPWLARANNSVALHRQHATEAEYRRIFEMTAQFGEPGAYWLDDYDDVPNPCVEALLQPRAVNATGFGFCNLTTMNAAMFRSLDDFERAARAATLIGTIQASYTDFPYLTLASRECAERDALLGVSMTGMQDAPGVALDPANQQHVAALVKQWNAGFAAVLGINPAARTTLGKPEGTSSLVLACKKSPAVASGIHPHHARRYIRRVTANEMEPPFQAFRKLNPHMCEQKPNGDWVVSFPIQVGEDAVTRDDLGAVDFLKVVHSTQQNWALPGTRRGSSTHTISNTVSVKPHEWGDVADYLWEHRRELAGVSFMPWVVDTLYQYAPFEAVSTPEQLVHWEYLARNYIPVDYSRVREDQDATSHKSEMPCAGGQCEWSPAA